MNENTVFIGGSRHVTRLPTEIKQRLDNVMSSGHRVIVGDANGADKAVQKYFHEALYNNVTVFCSGVSSRNNLGNWRTRNIDAPKSSKGFQFYAAKDREMAREADFGLMIWDGKSPGTILNVLRLVRSGKIAVLFNAPEKRAINIKTLGDWESFVSHLSDEMLKDLRARATREEWQPNTQQSLLDEASDQSAVLSKESTLSTRKLSESKIAELFNTALAAADPTAAVDALGSLAKIHGMSAVAKETGLARESLYRALSSDGNPEFATVLKVLSSLGLRFNAVPTQTSDIGTKIITGTVK